jgi:hypothetical protein
MPLLFQSFEFTFYVPEENKATTTGDLSFNIAQQFYFIYWAKLFEVPEEIIFVEFLIEFVKEYFAFFKTMLYKIIFCFGNRLSDFKLNILVIIAALDLVVFFRLFHFSETVAL